jgi:hypothetical protein
MQERTMRRLLAAMIAASLALSPVAFFGVTAGMQAAHADLGWCDECDIVVVNPGTAAPVPAPALPPVHRFH